MKIVRNLIVIFLLGIVFVSCKETKSEKEDEIVFVIPSEGSSYDINLSNETYGLTVTAQISETLVKIDSEGNLVSGASDSWDVSDDNKKFTFHLREGLQWSDGVKLTANHYKDGFLRIIDPKLKPANSSMLTAYILNAKEYFEGKVSKDEVGISVLDDRTLVLTLTRPTPFLLDILTHLIFTPARIEVIESGGEGWHKNPNIAVSNGPFVLGEYVKDDYTTIVKNHNYWNADNVKLDKIKFKMRGNDPDIISKFNTGEVDGVYEILSSDFRLVPDSNIESFTRLMPSTAFIIINHESGILKNKEFREALSVSIDREFIVKNALFGAGVPTDYLVPFIYKIGGEPFRDYVDLIKGVDVERAKGIITSLKDKGEYNNEPIRFFYMETGVDSVASKEIIKQYREGLGVEVVEKVLPWSDLYEAAKSGDYDLIMMGWSADFHHPMTFLPIFTDGSFYKPLIRWHSDEYENAVEASHIITDDKEYLEALRGIEDIILSGNHIIPIYHRKNLFLMSDKVKGWYTRGINFIFDEAYLE